MESKTALPFGTWPSSLSAEKVASAAPKINHIQCLQSPSYLGRMPDPMRWGRNVIIGRSKKRIDKRPDSSTL